MTVISRSILPPGFPPDMMDPIVDESGIEFNAPAGMIVYTHYLQDGRIHAVSMWDSQDHHDAFIASRLGPAMMKIAAATNFDLTVLGPTVNSTAEVQRLIIT